MQGLTMLEHGLLWSLVALAIGEAFAIWWLRCGGALKLPATATLTCEHAHDWDECPVCCH